MKNPVIAIGLDAADNSLIEAWMSQGHLNNLARIRQQGTYTHLRNFDCYRAETPWTTFLTGCSPQKTGYWAPVKLRQGSYDITEIGAYDFGEYPPFYALEDRHRVAIFDVPHSRPCKQVNGIQVYAWGAHSPLAPTESHPPQLLHELERQYGKHPTLHKDFASCLDLAALHRLRQGLEAGILGRAAICQDLLQREPWDLFLTAFGETHSAAHYLWHLSQPDHPLHALLANTNDDPLLAVFKAVDQAIGKILAQAPENAYVLVFSGHGMGANVMDLPSMVFLPELLYRFNFPGQVGIAAGQLGTPPTSPLITGRAKRGSLGALWSLKHDPNPLRRFLRKNTPGKIFGRLEPYLNYFQQQNLVSPFQLQQQSEPLYYQPALWYKPCWSQMKAFALPSFSEGYIRINLQGREPAGVVTTAEYEALCNELSQHLYRLTDARTGKPMVKQVIRTRQDATDCDPKLPDADLVVIWQEDHATDVVASPTFGRIGPVPYFRTGSHRSRGFFLAKGPGIVPGSSLPIGHALDLAPTILNLMGAAIPEYCEGKSMLATTPTLVS
ncbi:alkaline phosphatase family protein [Gloeocapsopsis dulcis]|uniref:Nucleotide pyrophosphatase n=1 Tax=Gloeocapsopsis dulcis AAB1 = 1H9 TaxID=1433147 RepID=A0A6N8FUJ9_9CHRO|nr:alkaline phosphatase family protein [Gloeocapsopsis dulcis]MUL35817.1 nucleotide pyrophosphatase [Gloeocapsopsis dulcis AAB1 = 1H9]WNN87716.1 alkaline phosphatase family protein [Gloeocapsopsis dulcis]